MTFDGTIHIAELLVLFAAAWGFFKGGLGMRDAVRDMTQMMGRKNPPEGLIGDVEMLKVTASEHREWLIAAGLDRRTGEERRDWRHP